MPAEEGTPSRRHSAAASTTSEGGRVIMTRVRIALGAIRMWQSGRYAEDADLARDFFAEATIGLRERR